MWKGFRNLSKDFSLNRAFQLIKEMAKEDPEIQKAWDNLKQKGEQDERESVHKRTDPESR
jgi:hypothetical protein